jgi:hypothetical protein
MADLHAGQKSGGETLARVPDHEDKAPEPVEAESATFLLGSAARGMAAGAAPPEDPTAAVGAYLHAAGPDVRSRVTLDVQRCAGNAALQRMIAAGGDLALQRSAFSPSMLSATAPAIPSGRVTASTAADKVTLSAPEVRFTSTVQLNSPVDTPFADLGVGDWIQAGPTQSVVSSERIGVYRRGGTADGQVTSEEKSRIGSPKRDAQTDPRTKRVMPDVHAPWYSRTSYIQTEGGSATVDYFDQPSADFPLTRGSGTITEFRGHEQFVTSVAANTQRDTATIHHLEKMEWEIDWNVAVNAAGQGEGGGLQGRRTEKIPPTLTGPIAVAAAETWVAFRTVDEAMTQPADVLLRYLGAARTHDPAAFATIKLALQRMNPTFTATVTVNETDNALFDDDLWVRLSYGDRVVERKAGGDDLGDGDRGAATFSMNDLIDLDTFDWDAPMKIVLVKKGVVWGGNQSRAKDIWAPFTELSEPNFVVNTGNYTVAWSAG